MYSLFRKEITGFFGSVTGYLVAFVFLIANGLFLWVFPGNYNLLENGYATLDSYFSLAPWIFLFLVPALTMRLIAEEKRLGTLEILVTRPLSLFQLVWAKYLAGLFLVAVCLLPTLVYFYSIYALGNPVGNWDSGAAWGSFTGLFFLAAAYVAIGLLASSLTDNQIFAFMAAFFLSFFFYTGFDFMASMNLPVGLKSFFNGIGINKHYLSMSRGVVDSRDVVYFVSLTFFVLMLTSIFLRQKQKKLKKQLQKLALLAVGLILLAGISSRLFFRIDLTTEQRYSLSPISKELINQLDAPVKINLFLAGELPPGFRKLQLAVEEKIEDMNAYADIRVRYESMNPYQLKNANERNQLFENLISLGLQPTDLRLTRDEGTVTHLIFPGAVIRYKGEEIGVNLLKNNPALAAEVNLNNSVETLEFELMRALQQLLGHEKDEVAFLNGQSELNDAETHDLRTTLSENYRVTNRLATDLVSGEMQPKALIIADPSQPFSETDKFFIDQYLMRGGNLLWLVDPVLVSLDSLSRGETTLAFPRDLNLMDQLFRYGVRVNPVLVQDVECLMIPVNTAPVGSAPKFTPAPWYYSPLLTPAQSHVISRNLNRLKAEFVSSIDTVGQHIDVKKTVILHTSTYSRIVKTPEEISLQSINNPPSRNLFQQSLVPVGVLLEGQFSSAFKNRITEDFNTTHIEFLPESKPAKIIVLADGSLIANQVSRRNGQTQTRPLGYDNFSQQTFGNKEFLVNAVNYLCDDTGIMSLRSRVFKLRLLDKVKVREEKFFWQLLNLLAPLALISLFGLIFNFVRKRKYRG
ncbi:gliding motility-associated ABC transporter substrate-binding protein GldG [Gaoshiqia sediminis]|uniref:Gliding motility-associated ABC transporter substrate-binding protein GldG n=1 Tax=Gaoshiqia sediminis TaxID=2986998 RepID=A0AA41YD20_9BACT|nr:gliding motility-associated ABC transporter substrate-binding protein GldG [Gaoshiqia sediminis]MCW0482997.1 gliding motility-associated ABC transporter substrate-binding protein GldG [Gaoshiqia sediminis]